jgi:hypothetical protein
MILRPISRCVSLTTTWYLCYATGIFPGGDTVMDSSDVVDVRPKFPEVHLIIDRHGPGVMSSLSSAGLTEHSAMRGIRRMRPTFSSGSRKQSGTTMSSPWCMRWSRWMTERAARRLDWHIVKLTHCGHDWWYLLEDGSVVAYGPLGEGSHTLSLGGNGFRTKSAALTALHYHLEKRGAPRG